MLRTVRYANVSCITYVLCVTVCVQASLWMVASDAYLRDDQNSAAQVASKAAIKGAFMGDVTASGTTIPACLCWFLSSMAVET